MMNLRLGYLVSNSTKKTELETAQNNMSNKDKGKQKLKTLGF